VPTVVHLTVIGHVGCLPAAAVFVGAQGTPHMRNPSATDGGCSDARTIATLTATGARVPPNPIERRGFLANI